LVVEDDVHVRAVLTAQLRRQNISATEAATGDAAIALYTRPGLFDIVLLDMVMPGRAQGRDVARHIRALDRDVGIIVLSGYAGGLEMPDPGIVDAVLAKPFAKSELFAHIDGFSRGLCSSSGNSAC
jgi:two-component system phosphate regulon response regulator OmpR